MVRCASYESDLATVSKRTEHLALTGILLLAAVLRFTALGWGLRHTPIRDEQDFVENVGEMIVHGDLDHRFYEYPGLFFTLLRPVLALAPASPPYHSEWDGFPHVTHFGPTGYRAARGLVAASGVASVFLVHRLGVALLGAEGGLVAALLMAVSPVEVFVGHEVRPDVVLESFVLLAILSFRRMGSRLKDDGIAGFAVAAAAAIKFTGILIAPCYLLARWLTPGPKLRGALSALLAAALLWSAATPYALVTPRSFLGGVTTQVGWHYRGRGMFPKFAEALVFYLATFAWSLGYIGAVLAVVGLFAIRHRWRAWAPALSYALLLVLVLASAYVHWHRLALSGVGIATLVAAAGFDAVRRRWVPLAWCLALAAALIPLYLSATYLHTLLIPGSRDLVTDWIDGHLPHGSRIMNTVDELPLDRARFEVIGQRGTPGLDRLLARQSGFVVWRWPDRKIVAGLETLFRAEPTPLVGAFGQTPELSLRSLAYPIIVFGTPPSLHPDYRPVALDRAQATASARNDAAHLAVDGHMDTAWSTAAPRRQGDWFQLLLDRRCRLGRVDLLLGDQPPRGGSAMALYVTNDGTSWKQVAFAHARPRAEEQLDRDRGGASQILVLEPILARGVRLVLNSATPESWGFSELHLQSLDEP